MHSKVQSLIAVRESKLRLINPTKQRLPHYILSPIVSPNFISWRLFLHGILTANLCQYVLCLQANREIGNRRLRTIVLSFFLFFLSLSLFLFYDSWYWYYVSLHRTLPAAPNPRKRTNGKWRPLHTSDNTSWRRARVFAFGDINVPSVAAALALREEDYITLVPPRLPSWFRVWCARWKGDKPPLFTFCGGVAGVLLKLKQFTETGRDSYKTIKHDFNAKHNKKKANKQTKRTATKTHT